MIEYLVLKHSEINMNKQASELGFATTGCQDFLEIAAKSWWCDTDWFHNLFIAGLNKNNENRTKEGGNP